MPDERVAVEQFHTTARERDQRSPLILLQFYFDLPFDVGIAERALSSFELSPPGIRDWSGFDLQSFLGLPPLPDAQVRPCVVSHFRRAWRPAASPFANVQRAYSGELATALPSESVEPLERPITVVKAQRVSEGPGWSAARLTAAV